VFETLAAVSFLLSLLAVAALLAARAREVRANARVARLQEQVDRIAAHVGMPVEASPAGAASRDMVPGSMVAQGPSAEAIALYRSGHRIDAIKLYRTQSGVGLAEAKVGLERAAAVDASTAEIAADPAAPVPVTTTPDRPSDGRSLFT